MTFLPTRSGDFVGTPPRVRDIRGGGARERQSIWFRTFSHPELKFYDDLFYPANPGCRRKKRVPESISELLTARALSYWFMDDGGNLPRNQRRYYFFSTQSFPLEDQEILLQALKDNFSGLMVATIQKDRSYYRLYIRSKSTNRFVNLIRPYLNPCFDSKIQ